MESKYLPYVNGIYRILGGNTNGITGDVSRNAPQAPLVIQLEEPSGTISLHEILSFPLVGQLNKIFICLSLHGEGNKNVSFLEPEPCL